VRGRGQLRSGGPDCGGVERMYAKKKDGDLFFSPVGPYFRGKKTLFPKKMNEKTNFSKWPHRRAVFDAAIEKGGSGLSENIYVRILSRKGVGLGEQIARRVRKVDLPDLQVELPALL
jgi:hypothetical protein